MKFGLLPMNTKIISIIQIFPDFEEKIGFLFQTDENFRDLCLDYILCASMALEMKNDAPKIDAKLMEYEELQRNLEEEILQRIMKDEH